MRKEISDILDFFLFEPIQSIDENYLHGENSPELTQLFCEKFVLAKDFKQNLIAGCLQNLPLKYMQSQRTYQKSQIGEINGQWYLKMLAQRMKTFLTNAVDENLILSSHIVFILSMPALQKWVELDVTPPELHHSENSSDLDQLDGNVRMKNLNRLQDVMLTSQLLDQSSDTCNLLSVM